MAPGRLLMRRSELHKRRQLVQHHQRKHQKKHLLRLVVVVVMVTMTLLRPTVVQGFSVEWSAGHNRQADDAGQRYNRNASITNKDARSFENAGGILYKRSIFSTDELSSIRTDVESLVLKEEITSTVARNRVGARLPPSTEAYRLFQEGSLARFVQTVVGPDYSLSTNVPVEVRAYEKIGAGMEWHIDDVLYDPPQVEVVWTLENTSDCRTSWKPRANTSIEIVETEPNSVILLRAGGVPHAVSSLKHGKRTIIKCVYKAAEAKLLPGQLVDQFGSSSLKRKGKGRDRLNSKQNKKRQHKQKR